MANTLKARHDGRSTLEITDEYDAQDLFTAMLKLHFDDVRPEEWTPSYAGNSSRIDFLLKEFGLAIEVKMTMNVACGAICRRSFAAICRRGRHDCHRAKSETRILYSSNRFS
jgi:hypothetical protein